MGLLLHYRRADRGQVIFTGSIGLCVTLFLLCIRSYVVADYLIVALGHDRLLGVASSHGRVAVLYRSELGAGSWLDARVHYSSARVTSLSPGRTLDFVTPFDARTGPIQYRAYQVGCHFGGFAWQTGGLVTLPPASPPWVVPPTPPTNTWILLLPWWTVVVLTTAPAAVLSYRKLHRSRKRKSDSLEPRLDRTSR